MLLRCADCGAGREVTADADAATRFDGELNRRLVAVADAADRLELERMAGEVDTLVQALRLDLIDASDFAR